MIVRGLFTVVSAGKERSSSPVASSGFCPVFLRYLASDEEDVVVESGDPGAVCFVHHRTLTLMPLQMIDPRVSVGDARSVRGGGEGEYGHEIPWSSEHDERGG